jgi:hypothetical protein
MNEIIEAVKALSISNSIPVFGTGRAANIYYRVIDAFLLQLSRIIEEQGETAVPVFG